MDLLKTKYVSQSSKIALTWTVKKGAGLALEDFSRSAVSLYVIGAGNRLTVGCESVQCGIVTAEIAEGLDEGIYSLELLWVKNGDIHGTRCLQRSRVDNVFCITTNESEADSQQSLAEVAVATVARSYGYDGLSAYEAAVLKGYTGDENTFYEMGGAVIPDGSVTTAKLANGAVTPAKMTMDETPTAGSINPVTSRALYQMYQSLHGAINELSDGTAAARTAIVDGGFIPEETRIMGLDPRYSGDASIRIIEYHGTSFNNSHCYVENYPSNATCRQFLHMAGLTFTRLLRFTNHTRTQLTSDVSIRYWTELASISPEEWAAGSLPEGIVKAGGELYKLKEGRAYPVAHPDISTQSSRLPQRVGTRSVYEVMIPLQGVTHDAGSDGECAYELTNNESLPIDEPINAIMENPAVIDARFFSLTTGFSAPATLSVINTDTSDPAHIVKSRTASFTLQSDYAASAQVPEYLLVKYVANEDNPYYSV